MAQVRTIGDLFHQRLLAQAELLACMTGHPTVLGDSREGALAALVREFLPRRYEVLSGAIVPAAGTAADAPKNQFDLLICDTFDFPVPFRDGELAAVLPQAVRGAVEVKSKFNKDEFANAYVQAVRAKRQSGSQPQFFSGVFSYGAPETADTLREYIEYAFTQLGDDHPKGEFSLHPDLIVTASGFAASTLGPSMNILPVKKEFSAAFLVQELIGKLMGLAGTVESTEAMHLLSSLLFPSSALGTASTTINFPVPP